MWHVVVYKEGFSGRFWRYVSSGMFHWCYDAPPSPEVGRFDKRQTDIVRDHWLGHGWQVRVEPTNKE